MENFLGTIILVVVGSFFQFVVIEISDYRRKEKNKKYERGYTTKDNAVFCFGLYSVIAIAIWLLIWASKLLS